MSVFAERTLRAVDAGGDDFEMTVRVGTPYPAAVDWACAVSVSRLAEAPRDLVGVDSWQAVQVGFQFIAHMLDGFVARGGRLFWQGTDIPVNVADLFVRSPNDNGSASDA